MNNQKCSILIVGMIGVLLGGCSQQSVEQVAVVPSVEVPPVQEPMPAPQVYQDVVNVPEALEPAPMPAPVVARPAPRPTVVARPAPVMPRPVYVPPPKQIRVPPVKAKGNYRGAVPIDNVLRQQYQQ